MREDLTTFARMHFYLLVYAKSTLVGYRFERDPPPSRRYPSLIGELVNVCSDETTNRSDVMIHSC
jgi:hypothetical protein